MGKGSVVHRHPGMKLIVHRPDLHLPRPADTVASMATPAAVKLGHLRRALRRWQAAGSPLASRPVRRARAGICTACEHWAPLGNLGLGECRAPGCGCTRAKWWLATEACPLGKWGPAT